MMFGETGLVLASLDLLKKIDYLNKCYVVHNALVVEFLPIGKRGYPLNQ